MTQKLAHLFFFETMTVSIVNIFGYKFKVLVLIGQNKLLQLKHTSKMWKSAFIQNYLFEAKIISLHMWETICDAAAS